MINDVSNFIMNSHPGVQTLFNADALVLWCADQDSQIIQDSFNITLDTLRSWAKDNEMKINLSKTIFQVVTLSIKPKEVELIYDKEKLQRT